MPFMPSVLNFSSVMVEWVKDYKNQKIGKISCTILSSGQDIAIATVNP